jgi:hypothetical protein
MVKKNNILKDKKVQALTASGVLLLALAGGGYYLGTRQDAKLSTTPADSITALDNNTPATTDPQIQQNVEKKADAAAGAVTTTPSVVASQPAVGTLTDGSLTILLDSDKVQAYVSFYGSPGTYGAGKLVNGTWKNLIATFTYSGSGGQYLDTMTSADETAHYRIFKLENGSKTATSGDTAVSWSEILSKGAFSVPLAR